MSITGYNITLLALGWGLLFTFNYKMIKHTEIVQPDSRLKSRDIPIFSVYIFPTNNSLGDMIRSITVNQPVNFVETIDKANGVIYINSEVYTNSDDFKNNIRNCPDDKYVLYMYLPEISTVCYYLDTTRCQPIKDDLNLIGHFLQPTSSFINSSRNFLTLDAGPYSNINGRDLRFPFWGKNVYFLENFNKDKLIVLLQKITNINEITQSPIFSMVIVDIPITKFISNFQNFFLYIKNLLIEDGYLIFEYERFKVGDNLPSNIFDALRIYFREVFYIPKFKGDKSKWGFEYREVINVFVCRYPIGQVKSITLQPIIPRLNKPSWVSNSCYIDSLFMSLLHFVPNDIFEIARTNNDYLSRFIQVFYHYIHTNKVNNFDQERKMFRESCDRNLLDQKDISNFSSNFNSVLKLYNLLCLKHPWFREIYNNSKFLFNEFTVVDENTYSEFRPDINLIETKKGINYKLVSLVSYKPNPSHFICYIYQNDNWWVYNDLKSEQERITLLEGGLLSVPNLKRYAEFGVYIKYDTRPM